MIIRNESSRKISIMAPACAYYKALLVKTSQHKNNKINDLCRLLSYNVFNQDFGQCDDFLRLSSVCDFIHTHTFQVQENLQIPIQCDSLTFSLTLFIQGEQIGNFSSIDLVVNFQIFFPCSNYINIVLEKSWGTTFQCFCSSTFNALIHTQQTAS